MMEYASGRNRCRSLFLLAYFGEKGGTRCGQCDVCMMEDDLELNRHEFDHIQDMIRKILQEKPRPLEALVKELSLQEEKSIRVIRWLMDHNRILRQSDENLCWHTQTGKLQ